MDRQRAHTDWTLLPLGQFPQRPNIQFRADIELASSFIKNILYSPALPFVLLLMFVLTFLVAIPNAQAPVALFEGITFLSALRAEPGRVGPTFVLLFHRVTERQ